MFKTRGGGVKGRLTVQKNAQLSNVVFPYGGCVNSDGAVVFGGERKPGEG